MRITGGKFRKNSLIPPKGAQTRPTSDRVRENIFNILNHAPWSDGIKDRAVLDLFCGTGALGIEAISQGAVFCSFIDKSDTCVRTNIDHFNLHDAARVLKVDALTLRQKPAHIAPARLVFVDPPYGQDLAGSALAQAVRHNWIAPDAICLVEQSKKHPETIPDDLFELLDERTYADTVIRFYRLKS